MTRSYCTLFDKNYLYQAVALHDSLVRHAGDFRLYALCMDSIAYDLLTKMKSSHLIPVSVDDLITPEVAAVRARTTHGQFCWVCQPLICEFVLERFAPDMVTYLEADSMFFSSPEPLFEELGSRSASLVPHNYSSNLDNSETAGRFCVQFNAFRNDAAAREVLAYWKQWCFKYDKSRRDFYPGQTNLDDWPRRFQCVAIIEHRGAGVAPWNIRGYRLQTGGVTPLVEGVPVVFYHYHQYGRFKNGAHELGSYPMSRDAIDCFYRPYVKDIAVARATVQSVDPAFNYRREYAGAATFADILNTLKRKIRGRYNVYPDAYFSSPRQGLQ